MILIYGKGKVGSALAALCEYQNLSYEIRDDTDALTDFTPYDYIIPSPGIPVSHQIYATGKVVAELDFAYQFLPKSFSIIAVTGTDGKSTTSWILYNIINKEHSVKKQVYLSGNFDVPFSETVREILKSGGSEGYIIVEISSFMSYAIGKHPDFEAFSPDYSIFTNFRKDHLNWHGTLQDYLDAKMNLLAHTKKKSIISDQVKEFADDNSLTIHFENNCRFYGIDGGVDTTDGENIIIAGDSAYKLSKTTFSGIHNALNILASTLITDELGMDSVSTARHLSDIQGLPHRLENIGQKNGIILVEDSKGTSAQSLEAALSSFGTEKNLLLIVGGSDKGDSFDHLSEAFKHRVKALACIGVTKDHFIRLAKINGIPYLATDSIQDAVSYLFANGEVNDVLMLSPGCASFGLFRDYLDRANQFREAIKKLP